MNKYRVKNCPAISFAGGCQNGKVKVWDCQDCTDCVVKQIVGLCKKTVKIFSAKSGIQPYAGGRCIEAEGVLQLLDIQEVE